MTAVINIDTDTAFVRFVFREDRADDMPISRFA
jgi:hypothetical protein